MPSLINESHRQHKPYPCGNAPLLADGSFPQGYGLKLAHTSVVQLKLLVVLKILETTSSFKYCSMRCRCGEAALANNILCLLIINSLVLHYYLFCLVTYILPRGRNDRHEST